MAESHTDVTDDQWFLRKHQRRVVKNQILHSDLFDLCNGLKSQMIHFLRIVSEFSDKLLFAFFSFLYSFTVDRISENNTCLIHV